MAQFKVEIELGEVHTGPVITRYDVHPAAGVRVEKIANLDKNLAMALKADSVRILAPVQVGVLALKFLIKILHRSV